METKKIFSIAILLLLVAGLITASFFVYRQVSLRSKAAGGGVTLSLAAPTTVTAGNSFDVVVNLTNSVTTNKITAASVSAVYDTNKLTLVSVTAGPLFTGSYVANSTEMLSIGTTCAAVVDCKTTASGVACTSGFCTNNIFTGNTAGSVKFWLGVPCTAAEPWVCYLATNVSAGQVATIRFQAKSAASGSTSINFESAAVTALGIDTSVLDSTTGTTTTINSAAAPTLAFGFKLLQNNNTVARTADVMLKSTTQTLSFPGVALTGSSGVFSPTTAITLTGVTTGTNYDVLVKVPGYLRKKLGTITINAGANMAPTSWNSILPAGVDFDGDNVLRGQDIANILGLYTKLSTPVTTATQVYDVNGDGNITTVDVANALGGYTAISVSGDN